MKKNVLHDENALLNKYMLIGWGLMSVYYIAAFVTELKFGGITGQYFLMNLAVTMIPYLYCFARYRKDKGRDFLRHEICVSYLLMYGFCMFTGETNSTYMYIFPLLSFLTVYRDTMLVLRMGIVSIILNIVDVFLDYRNGLIVTQNFSEYEIRIALLIFCFCGFYISCRVYDEISLIHDARQLEVSKLNEQKLLLEEKNKYAVTDAMTGLGNRRKYDEYVASLDKKMPEVVNFTFVDINGLKVVNDTLGHEAGDELITGAAQCMKMVFTDDKDQMFRIGGDEFIAVSFCDREKLEEKLQRLSRISKRWKGEHVKSLSLAIGSACKEAGRKATVKQLYDAADEKMYAAKKAYYEQTGYERRRE